MSRVLGRIALSALSISLIVVACQDDETTDEDDGAGASGAGTGAGMTNGGNGGTGAGTGAGQQGGGGNPAGEMNCTDGIDNDMDTFTDCIDFDCCSDAACVDDPNCMEPVENDDTLCGNNMDDDMDGLTDCEDDSCHGHPDVTVCNEASAGAFATVCSDGLDNDDDGFIDCDDRDCQLAAAANNTDGLTGVCWNDNTDGVELGDLECDDGDNQEAEDGNMFTDCQDRSCQASIVDCVEGNATIDNCDDDADNNNHSSASNFDQFVDCDGGLNGTAADFDCTEWGYCPGTVAESTTAECSDGLDNDQANDPQSGGPFIDCGDFSCQNSKVQRACDGNAVTCSDGRDNDANGFTDCADFACRCCPGEGDACSFEDVVSTCAPCTQ